MRIRARFFAAILLTCSLLLGGAPAGGLEGADALHRKVLGDLDEFVRWLDANDAEGFVGEFGWPDDHAGDAEEWNALAEAWYRAADAAGLSASVWATGEWWPPDYPLAVYENSSYPLGGSVDAANTQAPVVEAHLSAAGYRRGIDVATGTFCEAHGLEKKSWFSNRTPGKYGECYIFDSQETFDYLASRGIDLVTLEFRWEHVQRRLGGSLHDKGTQRLKDAVSRARTAGLDVVLSMHNFGAYWLWNGEVGVRRPIGSRKLPIKHFADVWRRLAREFKGTSGILYKIMAEPVGLPSRGDLSPREVWEKASQKAVNAIRGTGDTHPILVNGYQWSALRGWVELHPAAWISDPANSIFYTAHHYWDRDQSGHYQFGYADEVAHAEQEGY